MKTIKNNQQEVKVLERHAKLFWVEPRGTSDILVLGRIGIKNVKYYTLPDLELAVKSVYGKPKHLVIEKLLGL